MKIEDGKGSGRFASVSGVQRLNVSSKTAPRVFYISRDDGEAYNWTSSFSAGTGNEIVYIKNNSTTKKLIIESLAVGGVLTGLFEIFECTGTAGGTPITGKNINLSSNNEADATSYGNASVTGLVIGDRIGLTRTAATSSNIIIQNGALQLSFNDAICVTYTGSTGIVDCVVRAYFEDTSKQ